MNAGKGSLESPFRAFSDYTGFGPFDGTDGDTTFTCSKVTTFSTSDCPSDAPSESPSDAPSKSASPTAKASKRPRGTKVSKTPKASTLQAQAMKSGGSPSFSSLTIVGVCGMFAVITFMFIDLI